MPILPAARLQPFAESVFLAAGVADEPARAAADVLAWTSLRGVDTHGIRNLKRYYVEGIDEGLIRPDAEFVIERESPVSALVNANAGLGLSDGVQAMQMAIEKAHEAGVGLVSVRNSNHFGAAGYFAHMAVEHDMLGFAATGYFFPKGQRTAVVPFGGRLPMFSTNPLAVACPAGESPPFVLDMSTSVAPVNRLELMQERGERISPEWALDAEGKPTTDPAQIERLIPLGGLGDGGGQKGFGLAMAVQILTGMLSGAWRSAPEAERVLGDCKETVHGYAQEGIAHLFAAVRLDQFASPEEFRRGLDVLARVVTESPAAPGAGRVTYPGQLEYETQLERIQRGVPVTQQTWDDLRVLSRRFGVPLDAES